MAEVIRTLIVDDEELARDRLQVLLKPFRELEIVGHAGDGEEAIEKIVELRPDLVFLDIQMPACSGIEVAASLAAGRPKVVFCTAYDEYALDAFEVHAVDYLLKPVSRVRLARAVEKVRRELEEGEAVERVVASVVPTRFLGKRASKFTVVSRDSVLYFFSEGGLTQLNTSGQHYWMEPTLTDLEKRVDRSGFFRISRQALINLDHVTEVVPLIGGHGQVKLSNGKVLDVSRRRMKGLIERLEGK
jgi:DNA-binding LytR/AlgR family response regulator